MKTVPAWPAAVGALVVALLVVALLGGCAWDGPMSTVVARSDLARSTLSVYGIITWASAIIGTLVFVALGWILWRFRERPGGGLPRQIHGHALLEIAWTIAPALVLLGSAEVVVSREDVARVAHRLPQGELIELAGARHEIFMERAELTVEVWRRVDRFLERLPGPAARSAAVGG